MPPTGAGSLVLCGTVDDFADAGGSEIRTLVVAGVGSSALGAAAFARNVADACGTPVAAVVSGYGLADLLTEALGGTGLPGSARLTAFAISSRASTRSAVRSIVRRRSVQ